MLILFTDGKTGQNSEDYQSMENYAKPNKPYSLVKPQIY